MKQQYIFEQKDGTLYPTNDEDNRPMILDSKAHAKRVIKWLGLTDVVIVEATEAQVASGCLVRMHQQRYGVIGMIGQGGRDLDVQRMIPRAHK